ncbi:MAG: hypothetical protein AAFZ07_17470 [Actinomycetota bacterium]
MGHSRWSKVVAAFVVVVGATLIGTTAGGAAERVADERLVPNEGEEHCVAHASGVDENGELIVSEPVCGSDLLVSALVNSSAMAFGPTYTIGRHYTGLNYTGSSITITGSVPCGGGVWKPSGSWNNNIESSRHYCGGSPTRFYNSSSCSGSSTAIYSSTSTLGWMNNLTSCVRYG